LLLTLVDMKDLISLEDPRAWFILGAMFIIMVIILFYISKE
jgi:hypothetical protein